MNQKEVMAIRDVALQNRDHVELFQSRGVSLDDLKEVFRLAAKGAQLERAEQVSKSDGHLEVSHDGARAVLTRALLAADKKIEAEMRDLLTRYIAQQEARFVAK